MKTTAHVMSVLLLSAAASLAANPCNTGKAGGAGCGALASPLNSVTGVNPMGGAATHDGNWYLASPYPSYPVTASVSSLMPCTLSYVKAWVDTPNTMWNVWLPENSFSASQWIEPKKEDVAGGYYIYKTSFTVPAGKTSLTITGQLSSDNQTVEILADDPAAPCHVVHGTVNPAGPGTSDYQQWWPFTFTTPVTASHKATLYFVVLNYGAPPTPIGFRLEFNSVSYAHPVSGGGGIFTGSNVTDLAIADAGTNTVSVLLGTGKGTFQPGGSYPVGTNPTHVVIADFNGDGNLDIAVADSGSTAADGTAAGGGAVSILLGNGDGTFQPAQNYPVGISPVSLAVGDLNGDGFPDLAVADAGSGTVYVLLGHGQNGFSQAQPYVIGKPGSSSMTSVLIADLNSDGIPDVAVTDAGLDQVDVLLGNGDGTLGRGTSVLAGKAPMTVLQDLVAGDFNNDGHIDLAVASAGANAVVILSGNGDGTFGKPVSYQVGATPSSLIAADFNGDGQLDLAVSNAATNDVSILFGTGKGQFQPAGTYQTGTTPQGLIAADLNGDGVVDLTTANAGSNDISVLLGNGNGTFQPPVSTPAEKARQ